MSTVRTILMVAVAAFAFSLAKPCSAQAFHAGAHANSGAHAAQVGNSSHHSHHWHSNSYSTPSLAYYPYVTPYNYYGYGRIGAYYPYGRSYSSFGYPVNLNSGLERGFQYGNTYINPNFGN